MGPYVAWTGAATLALLAADRAGVRAGVWVAKPLAAAGFVAAAFGLGALETGYGRWILGALILCWLGDVLLIPRGRSGAFRAGVVSFLLGHLLYATAFLWRGVAPTTTLVALALAALPLAAAARWLDPHLPRSLRRPIQAYLLVITGMVALAAGATGAGAPPVLLAGALLFYVSDLAVARERFVAPGFANRAFGRPCYFAGQLLLASTVAGG